MIPPQASISAMTYPSLSALDSEDSLKSFNEELLDLLLDVDEAYPWDTTTPDAEDYFNQIESEFSLLEALEESEIKTQADILFSHLDRCWSSGNTPNLRDSLVRKFEALVPSSCLETIIDQAEQLAMENVSQLTELVECVKPLWTNWTEDDLEVFARPLAYSMRGETHIKQDAWQELSEIEQIRFTMFIAQEILVEVRSHRMGKLF
ncbi:conserved hypothetical protein [Rippkaea orientalis PCC 8801]|uniref:Uncharacterized protein n=1 Tax=Rippkaea orientalis (strain PCC 8801 / RF-1) TaxID=41431 RepID=B7JYW8_RIPO1|nr:hypothetical protein [Rippkaea orientalis]ACK66045.1 conserved hypothetical protein [Rippkaea orientalis PCC 8801]